MTNSRDEQLTMYWVNYSGGTRSYGNINPGRTWSVTTYGSHPWLITTASDEIVGIYVPYDAAGNTQINIE